MEKIKKYQTIVEKILKERVAFPNKQFPNLKDMLIIDEKKSHFVLMSVGWDNQEYIHQVLFHLEVKLDGKIWIHENRTDLPIDEILITNSVEAIDILAGMIEPYSIDVSNTKAA